ncbi:hypothetical protein FBU30_009970 [Linnemannia zychae]|nr:hypothetical protein FBU30_009970 [Linnemannia zychae]
MSSAIPVYNHACLATNSDSDDLSFYLVDASSPGSIEVNYVNNADATTVKQVGSQTSQSSWTPNASKLCYIYPFSTDPNPGIKIIQFGSGTTYLGLAQTNNIFSDLGSFSDIGFISPKLFGWNAKFRNQDMFTVVTNRTESSIKWSGLRLSFQQEAPSMLKYDMVNDPVNTVDPLLVVGTYGQYSGNISQGHTIIFDKNNQGQIYVAECNVLSDLNNSILHISLGSPSSVNMNGIMLTEKALAITAGTTAYILDNNGGTVIYSITPSSSPILTRVNSVGDSLPFTDNLAASALRNKILTYSSSKNMGVFNVFDLNTHSWSGSGLIASPDPVPNPSKTPIGAIVGRIVGGLIVIFLLAFIFVRRRRSSNSKTIGNSDERSEQNYEMVKSNNTIHGNSQTGQYVSNDQAYHGQGYVQYNQEYASYNQGYQQQPPSFIPPPPPINQSMYSSHEICSSGITEVDNSNTDSTVVGSPYVSPKSYRDSTMPPESPESTHYKPQKSSINQSPQYIPIGQNTIVETRTPQATSP